MHWKAFLVMLKRHVEDFWICQIQSISQIIEYLVEYLILASQIT